MSLKKILSVTLAVFLSGAAVFASGIDEPESREVKKSKSFILGSGAGIFYVNQSAWSEIYSKTNALFGFKIGLQLKEKIEIFAESDYMKVSGKMEPTGDECSSTIIPVYVGARYIFKAGKLFHPHVGLAGVYGTLTEKGDFGSISAKNVGTSVQAGTYIKFNERLALDFVIKYDRLIFKNDEYDSKSDMSGVRLLLFFTYTFK